MRKDELSIIFADRLQQALDNNRMGPEDLDDAMIVQGIMVEKYLAGDHLPMLITAARIAEFLDVSLDWLCGMDGNDFDGMDRERVAKKERERELEIAPWLL